MFRDTLNHNICQSALARVVSKVFRVQSQLVMTLEKINTKRATPQHWMADSQFKSGKFTFAVREKSGGR